MHSQQHTRSHCDDMKIDEFDHHFQAGMDALATAKNQQQMQVQQKKPQQVVMNKQQQQQQKSQQQTVDMDQTMKKQKPQQFQQHHMAKDQHAAKDQHMAKEQHHHHQHQQHKQQHKQQQQQQKQTKKDERVAQKWEHVLQSVEELHDIVDAEEKMEFVKEHLHTEEQQQQQHDNAEEAFDGTVVYSIRHGGNRQPQQQKEEEEVDEQQQEQQRAAPKQEGLLARRSNAQFLRKYSQKEIDSVQNQPMVNESTTMQEDIIDYADAIIKEHKHKPMQSHAAKSLLSNVVVADLVQKGKLRLPAQLVGSKPSSRLFNRNTRPAHNKQSKKMRSLQPPTQTPVNYQAPPSPTDAELFGGATQMEHLMHAQQPPAPSAAEGLLDQHQVSATVASMNMDKEPHRFATYQTIALAGSKRQLAYSKPEHRFAARNQDAKEEMQLEMEDREGAEQREMLKQMQKEEQMQKAMMFKQSKKNQKNQKQQQQHDEEKHSSTHIQEQQEDVAPGEYTPPNISTQVYKDFSMQLPPNVIHPNHKPLAKEFDYSKHDWANGSQQQQQQPSSSSASEDEDSDAQWKTVGKDGRTHAPNF